MLPYFSASGHYHYQKSVYLYLQTMSQIHMTHPGLHKHFMNGLHVIRRSDRFWTGLSPDLVIEQVLMAEVNRAMQDFTGTKYQTRDQHKNTAQARITRDHLDGLKILQYLLERDPFTSEEISSTQLPVKLQMNLSMCTRLLKSEKCLSME